MAPGQHLVHPGLGTLQAALTAASSGDEVVLLDGMYTGRGDFVLDISKNVTIRAQNARQAVLNGEVSRQVIRILMGTILIDGLTVTNGSETAVRRLQDLASCHTQLLRGSRLLLECTLTMRAHS